MATVVWIRPGCTDFDEQQRIQGSLDLPLNSRGRAQVANLVEQLREVELDAIYTSSGQPAQSTAEALANELDLDLRETEGLCNINQGLWQGLKIEDIRRKDTRDIKQWEDSPQTVCPPEGETLSEAIERVRKTLQKPLKKKLSFAVVAAEPLATVVRYVVTGHLPDRASPICGGQTTSTVPIEFLESDSGLVTTTPPSGGGNK